MIVVGLHAQCDRIPGDAVVGRRRCSLAKFLYENSDRRHCSDDH